MTRYDLLHLLVGQARAHGFDFKRWFTQATGAAWTGYAGALDWLVIGKRAHMLLFSHGFARHFFQSGERITFLVPPQTFQRVAPGGGTLTVNRKAHLRRSSREDVWMFHLREMAAAAEPLRYIRRFLVTEETMQALADVAESLDEEGNYDNENLVRENG